LIGERINIAVYDFKADSGAYFAAIQIVQKDTLIQPFSRPKGITTKSPFLAAMRVLLIVGSIVEKTGVLANKDLLSAMQRLRKKNTATVDLKCD
jgi:hypothetical protein